jgi:glycosyltransferase involved in cell wall biosynthesis
VKTKQTNILYLGNSGFPYGLAEVQKLLLISKSLVSAGATVTVVSSRGVHNVNITPGILTKGTFEGINYVYTSGSAYREPNFIKRNFYKLFEKFKELKEIRQINKQKHIDAAIISSKSFFNLCFYKSIAYFIGFKIILNFVEYNSAMAGRKTLFTKFQDFLFDKYALKIADGILPISEFLISIIKDNAPHKPYLKIPVLVDMKRYGNVEKKHDEKYFLFCGAAAYSEIIIFIIKAFELLNQNQIKLNLVINGTTAHLNQIIDYANQSVKKDLIRIYNNVSDHDLSILYKSAIGLLIPLRPTLQDKARFPHKIGEYLASGNPVVTTNYGEVKHYFIDGVNAIIAEEYDIKLFSEKMNYLIEYPEQGIIIGKTGLELASKYFDNMAYGNVIINFINQL